MVARQFVPSFSSPSEQRFVSLLSLLPNILLRPPPSSLPPTARQAMCDFAVDAEKITPSNALFVDYSNLPDAVPEYVYPEHFGVAAEVAEVRHSSAPRFFILQT